MDHSFNQVFQTLGGDQASQEQDIVLLSPLLLHRVDPSRARRGDHFGRIVDAEHSRAASEDLLRERAFPAANVQDSLARLRIEQVERRPAELGDKGTDPRIVGRVPFRCRGDCLAQRVFSHS
jgi:hypothetical protein